MSNKSKNQPLLVYSNSKLVGTLSQLKSGELEFLYAQNWLSDPFAPAISMSIPLSDKVYTGAKVYNFFDNLLPDNVELRSRIQQRLNIKSKNSFDFLATIGKDCIGALQFLHQPYAFKNKITGQKKSDEQIADILKNYKSAPLGMQDGDFRISIAGAQEKTAFLRYKNAWWQPTEATATTHIFKLPIGKIEHAGIDLSNSIENEWICLKILKEFGIKVNNAQICKFLDTKALVVERFDRKWDKDHTTIQRVLQEDLCQAFGINSSFKYESDGGPNVIDIMNFLRGSENATKDRATFMQVWFLFWLLGAVDGHAKNFSIFLKENMRFCLTPIYDVISAYPLVNNHQLDFQKITMAMSARGKNKQYKWNNILLSHFLSTATHAGTSDKIFQQQIEKSLDTLEQVIDKVSSLIPENFSLELADAIFNGMRKAKAKIKI